MKKYLLILMFIVPVSLLAQKGTYTIKGKIGSLDSPVRIYLGYKTANGAFLDSAKLRNGQFGFKGTVEEPLQATLVLSYTGAGSYGPHSESTSIYLEKGSIYLNSPDSLSNAAITGSKINADSKRLKDALKESNREMEAVTSSYNALPADKKKDKEFVKGFMQDYIKRQNAIIDQQNEIRSGFIKKNPNSIVSLDALKTIDRFRPEYTKLAPLFDSLSPAVKNSSYGRAFANKLNKMKIMEVGSMALQFTQNDPEGNPMSLSSFKGKYVLVDFWASWCHACRLENPNVVKAYNMYHDKGLEILSVSLDKSKEAWLKAIKTDGMPWNHVSDLKGWRNDVALMYDVHAVPQNMLLDRTGKIIGKNLKAEELITKLAVIFK